MDYNLFINECEKSCQPLFLLAEETALKNQQRVLDAFKSNKIAPRHFQPSTGYAYDDQGRSLLSAVFKDYFMAQDAIVSPLFASGTHTIWTALFGILRPGDCCLSVTGKPYDTLNKAVGGQGIGSLSDFSINFLDVSLTKEGALDYPSIKKSIQKLNPKIIYFQRSKGYNWRKSFAIEEIKKAVSFIKAFTDAPIIVDNCYGEFVEDCEPIEAGASLVMGSLIKNPGGGLASSGGYIAGDSALIKQIEGRYSVPGVGFEIGAYPYGYQSLFQGLFIAPHTVLQAVKSYILFGEVFSKLGFEVLGCENKNTVEFDIVRAIKFKTEQQLLEFCRAIQSSSPVDSHVVPYPSKMPGYKDKVIMAAGTFIQGASIELTADAPVRPPYIAYIQGALTYEHAKIACINCARAVNSN